MLSWQHALHFLLSLPFNLIHQGTEVEVCMFILHFEDRAASTLSEWQHILHAFRCWSNRVSSCYVWYQRQWGCPVLAEPLVSGPTARGQQCCCRCWPGDVMLGLCYRIRVGVQPSCLHICSFANLAVFLLATFLWLWKEFIMHLWSLKILWLPVSLKWRVLLSIASHQIPVTNHTQTIVPN